jgi:bifunctional lysine-specific demethylase and histidyl-hydroxylase NO66
VIEVAMRTRSSAFQRLLGEQAEASFVDEYWERMPLHVDRQDAAYFSDLFSLDAFDALMARGDVWYPNIRVFMTGEQLAAGRFTTTWSYGRETHRRIVDVNKLIDLLSRGATINVLGLERSVPAVMTMSKALEIEAGFPVHTTAFLTPPSAVNVPPHYDMVDVIVAQVHGSKVWNVWRPTREQPLVTDTGGRLYEHGDAVVAQDMLIGTYELKAGDALYVPRGFLHEAVTTDEPSLHLAFGINVHRWFDVLENAANHALAALTEEAEHRKALPVPPTSRAVVPADAEHPLNALAGELRGRLRSGLDRALSAADARYLDSRTAARPGQLTDIARLPMLSLDDVLILRTELAYGIWSENGRLRISYHQKRLSLDGELEGALRHATSGTAFRARDLPGLTAQQQVAFARKLVMEGMLRFEAVEPHS